MSLTLIIVIITAVISIRAFNNPDLFNKLKYNPYQITRRQEWFRLVTYGFVHGDWNHLIINMLVLFSFGKILEYYFALYFGSGSKIYFLIFYFSSLILSCGYSFFRHKNDNWYNAVGASGAVSAVLFATIFFSPWEKILLMGIVPIPGIVFALLYLSYTVYMGRKGVDNVGHDAHFIGSVYGFIFPLIVNPSLWNNFINELFR